MSEVVKFSQSYAFFLELSTFFCTFAEISMNENLDPTDIRLSNAEKEVERALRPLSFSDF
jgi:hypothetical protein